MREHWQNAASALWSAATIAVVVFFVSMIKNDATGMGSAFVIAALTFLAGCFAVAKSLDVPTAR